MQHIKLNLDHFNFFCPVTGQQIFGPEHYAASPATAFVFVNEVGEFDHITDELERIDSQVNTEELMEEDPYERFERFCDAIKEERTLVIFTITTCGMACGPVSSTVHIGIDMNWEDDSDWGME